jgi:hypothetical protein
VVQQRFMQSQIDGAPEQSGDWMSASCEWLAINVTLLQVIRKGFFCKKALISASSAPWAGLPARF